MKNKKVEVTEDVAGKGNNRRRFLKMSGLAIAGSGLLLSCSDDDDFTPEPPNGDVFDLGKGDLGVLNYAYALEQLEAEFYTRVVNGSYWSGASEEEKTILEDIYNHEVNHREFFRAAITAAAPDKILPDLDFKLDMDFSSRSDVLSTSQLLEDTGVKAYNGAGKLIKDAGYLVIAGKIVSVEARHASAIRSILGNDKESMEGYAMFAGDDAVDPETGLDGAASPADIISAAGGFIKTPFTYNEQGVK